MTIGQFLDGEDIYIIMKKETVIFIFAWCHGIADKKYGEKKRARGTIDSRGTGNILLLIKIYFATFQNIEGKVPHFIARSDGEIKPFPFQHAQSESPLYARRDVSGSVHIQDTLGRGRTGRKTTSSARLADTVRSPCHRWTRLVQCDDASAGRDNLVRATAHNGRKDLSSIHHNDSSPPESRRTLHREQNRPAERFSGRVHTPSWTFTLNVGWQRCDD